MLANVTGHMADRRWHLRYDVVSVDKAVRAMQLAVAAWQDPEVYRKMKEQQERELLVRTVRVAIAMSDAVLWCAVMGVAAWAILSF